MIQIQIDKTNATAEEVVALESTTGYQQFISGLVNKGRKLGIALTIKDVST